MNQLVVFQSILVVWRPDVTCVISIRKCPAALIYLILIKRIFNYQHEAMVFKVSVRSFSATTAFWESVGTVNERSSYGFGPLPQPSTRSKLWAHYGKHIVSGQTRKECRPIKYLHGWLLEPFQSHIYVWASCHCIALYLANYKPTCTYIRGQGGLLRCCSVEINSLSTVLCPFLTSCVLWNCGWLLGAKKYMRNTDFWFFVDKKAHVRDA